MTYCIEQYTIYIYYKIQYLILNYKGKESEKVCTHTHTHTHIYIYTHIHTLHR